MKSNKKTNKKTSTKNLKKTIFSVIVILIVLSFAASFFSSGIASSSASAAQATAYPTPTTVSVPSASASPTPSPTPSPDANVASFLTAIKDLMVVSEDATENATLIVGAINVYNTLNQDDMIIVNKTVDAAAIEKLISADIYFDDIAEDVEAAAWEMVVVDDNGMAAVAE